MKLTVSVKMLPSPDQHAALRSTMLAFNGACNAIAAAAHQSSVRHKWVLHHLVYKRVRRDFGLSAQLAVRAIAKVADAHKTGVATRELSQIRFRALGAIVYDSRILSIRGTIASIRVLRGRETIALIVGPSQQRLFARVKGEADLILRNNHFYLALTSDVPEPSPFKADDYLGIDLGVRNIAVDSDGRVFTGDAVETCRRRYQRLIQALQKCGTRSARRHLRRLRGREARFRRDVNHRLSKTLVLTAQGTTRGIALEELHGIRERITVRAAWRARVGSWSFSQIRLFLTYKAKLAGVPLLTVNPAHTSRTCNRCDVVDGASRQGAVFSCRVCGHTEPADINAAKNIAKRAGVVQPIVTLA